MSNFFPTSWNSETQTIDVSYNSEDFLENYGSIEKGDLRNYAHKALPNIFLQTNYFVGILVESINGVTKDVLLKLETITDNVQTVLNTLKSKTTNMNYDVNEDITNISDTVTIDSLTVKENVNCKNVATMKVLSNKMVCNDMVVTDINSKRVVCGYLKAGNVSNVGCYMFLENGRNVPVVKSGVLKTMAPSLTGNEFKGELTLMPGYRISFQDNQGQLLYVLNNESSDVLYSVSVELNEIPYKMNIYYESVLIS
jgi:nitrate reductase NapAB chaperone NapD